MSKHPSKNLVISALALAGFTTSASADLFPNGDFESPGGASWEEVSGGGTYNFAYPTEDGNPGGYGDIDHTAADGGFGIWVANDGVILTLDELGLTAGEAYQFTQDMILQSGSNIGGFKLDFFNGPDGAGSTGDLFPTLIGDGSTWETYTFEISIPGGVDGIKAVPLWGPDSLVGYDNIGFDPTPIQVPPVPNGDFKNGSASWLEIGSDTTWDYVAADGNPGGYGVMTNGGAAGSFGIWVANGGAPLALSDLGLAAGDMVTFFQDMRILSGDDIGGLKIEFLEGATFLGDTGDMRMDLIGDGSTWETYSFEVAILENATHIKIVPLWGPGSSVGYDNITFTGSAGPISLFQAAIETGTVVTWIPESDERFYQLQESSDRIEWDNVGPLIEGTGVSSAFIRNPAPFYRVEEFEVAAGNVVVNGGFENPDPIDFTCAESWLCIGSQAATVTTEDMRSGESAIRIAVQNDATGSPNNAEVQQNIAGAGGFVTPGESYDFSFWAKQVSSGVSYVQMYRVQWLDAGDAILPGGVGFLNFSGGDGEWVKISADDLVAPDGAATALIQIFGATGAVPGDDAKGEVLIDDVMLAVPAVLPFDEIDTEFAAGLEVSWDGEAGKSYQVEMSNDLNGFVEFGLPMAGEDARMSVGDRLANAAKFYRVVESPAAP